MTCEGVLKCWGANGFGQLGLGDSRDRGRSAAEMGDRLPAVQLSSGARAPGCATVANGSALGGAACWARPQVIQVSAGGGYCAPDAAASQPLGRTCAITANNHLQCWGDNSCGMLARRADDRSCGPRGCGAIGDDPSEMADGLPFVVAPPSAGGSGDGARWYQVRARGRGGGRADARAVAVASACAPRRARVPAPCTCVLTPRN